MARFLGNNSLSGPLPSQKSNLLQTIDLSYNFLSGSFPQWVTTISQLNLAVNNFTFDSSNITTLPGLNCLQRNFPCNRDTPRYANFSINCGGPQMMGRDGILYEAEDSALGPATFIVTSTEKWAVSNVETVFDRDIQHTWESLGRRVFDIYIQGTRRIKDFDISKEAGGVNVGIMKRFNVSVSENYLEIHLFWAGKGTCCIPGHYGSLIAALHSASDFIPTVSGLPPTTPGKKSRTGLIVGIAVPLGVVSLLLIFAILYMRRKKSEKEDHEGKRPYY